MRIIRDTLFIDPADRGAVAAIGNFDGVHLGHQSVISLTRDLALSMNAPLGIMTFEPHPRSYFAPDTAPFRLMNAQAKAERFARLGIEKLYEVPFNKALAELSPRNFAQDIIATRLGLQHIVVGDDFCFGADRAGTTEDLQRFGDEMDFGVTIAPLKVHDGGRVSSTAIRKALRDGCPRDAAAMLGHWHRIVGQVIRGDQRGRDLGYPTANMSMAGLHLPKFGVYAVKVTVLDGSHAGTYNGATSIGVRPMFGVNRPNLETFVFDFSGDLYGATLSVALIEYLRPEEKFDSLEALITQMDADCDRARKILAPL